MSAVEVWESIEDFNGYEVSNAGYVRRSCARNDRRLTPTRGDSDVVKVGIRKNKKTHKLPLALLVWRHFVDRRVEDVEDIYFKDGNPYNASVSNLGLCVDAICRRNEKITLKYLKSILHFEVCSVGGVTLRWKSRDSSFRRYTSFNKKFAGGVAEGQGIKGGYKYTYVLGKQIRSHRIIYMYLNNIENFDELPKYIDHVSGDTSDNSETNLRDGDYKQLNDYNRITKNETGFKGVSLNKKNGKYRAKIKVNGHHAVLGTFLTAVAAGKAYDEACHIVTGTYVRGNFDKIYESSLDEAALSRLYKAITRQPKHKKPHCGLKGVRWNKSQQKYSAYISIENSKVMYVYSNVDPLICMYARNKTIIEDGISLELSFLSNNHCMFSYGKGRGKYELCYYN